MKIGIFIGRFQPFHNWHYEICKYGLNNYEKMVIIIGSSRSPKTIKNPFTYKERVEMIKNCFSEEEQKRIIFKSIQDYMYSDTTWIANVQKIIKDIGDNDYTLIGHRKDYSSNYLDFFPQWEKFEFNSFGYGSNLNSTDIREFMFNVPLSEKSYDILKRGLFSIVQNSIFDYLIDWYYTSSFKNLQTEYNFIFDYKQKWKAAPYTPTFVTTDAVVFQAGHVLMIKRKINPGKDMYALPGGFLNQTETLIDGVIRELKEETNINLSDNVLRKSIIDSNVFDHPERDFRGRTITHAYLFKLNNTYNLYEVKGGDDAAEASWLSFKKIEDVQENIYADHYHIIQYFLGKV